MVWSSRLYSSRAGAGSPSPRRYSRRGGDHRTDPRPRRGSAPAPPSASGSARSPSGPRSARAPMPGRTAITLTAYYAPAPAYYAPPPSVLPPAYPRSCWYPQYRRLLRLLIAAGHGGFGYSAGFGARRAAQRPPVLLCSASEAPYRYFAGRIIARHICATGLLSKPRPSFGWRKLRPMMSVNSSSSTCTFGSNE